MTNHPKFAIAIFVLLFFGAGIALYLQIGSRPPVIIISFDDCARAGYPVRESYPRVCAVPGEQTFTESIGNELEKIDLIRAAAPRPNTKIQSPLAVTGEARGLWFFEASFPAVLLDGNGSPIGTGIIQAEGEWMTENFVPFSGTITFETPQTPRGSLILKKDNPSGLPEHDDELQIPVSF